MRKKKSSFLKWPGTDSVQKKLLLDFLKNCQVQVHGSNVTLQVVYKVEMFSTEVA
jgi:hypothetical protein